MMHRTFALFIAVAWLGLAGCQTTDAWDDADYAGYPAADVPVTRAPDSADRWTRAARTGIVPAPPMRDAQGSVAALERRVFPNLEPTDIQAFETQTYARQQEELTAQRLADEQSMRARGGYRTTFADRYLDDVDTGPRRMVYQDVSSTAQPMRMAERSTTPSAVLPPQDNAANYSVSGMPPMPSASPGECYALVRKPEQYRTVTERVVTQPAHEQVVTEPARYVTETQQVVVREGYERLETTPPQFRDVTERVLSRPATTEYMTEPPQYRTVTERVLVKPARTVWKPGRGPIERIDHATGEIMCLVEEPAQYKTITKRVLAQPAQVRERQVPPEYQTVSRRVLAQPAEVRRVRVPPEVRNVQVRRMVQPPTTRRVTVPAEYGTVEKQQLVEPARLEWRPVLCETNMTADRIRRLQSALSARGFDPGPIDGVLGPKTMEAVNAFQRANGYPVDRYLNMATMRALGVA